MLCVCVSSWRGSWLAVVLQNPLIKMIKYIKKCFFWGRLGLCCPVPGSQHLVALPSLRNPERAASWLITSFPGPGGLEEICQRWYENQEMSEAL